MHLGWHPYPVCEHISIKGAPRFMHGVRIMFASDIHIREYASDKYIADIAHMLESENADMLILSGDFGETTDDTRRFLAALDSQKFPLGIFGSPGNNDSEAYEGDYTQLRRIFPGTFLSNEATAICVNGGNLHIGGTDEIKHGTSDAAHLLPHDAEGYSILLSHFPWLPEKFTGARPDLMLSGHTHGGQIYLFGLNAYSIGYEKGLVCKVRGLHTLKGGTQLFISPGIGVSKLPIRFGARPKVHLLEFI